MYCIDANKDAAFVLEDFYHSICKALCSYVLQRIGNNHLGHQAQNPANIYI